MSTKPPIPTTASLADAQRAVDALTRSVARLNADLAPAQRTAPAPRPVPRADVALHSFGLTDAPGYRRVVKQAEVERVYPEAMAAWVSVLPVAECECLSAVVRFHVNNGEQPVPIPRADLAAHLRTTPEEAEALLNRLCAAGAVRRDMRFHSQPRYAPVAAPPQPKRAMKTDEGKAADPSALPRLRSAMGLRPR